MPQEKNKKKTVRKDNKKAIALRMTTEVVEELDSVCKEYGFSKGGFIEVAVKAKLAEVKKGKIWQE